MKITKIMIVVLLTLLVLIALTWTTHAQATLLYEINVTWNKWIRAYKIVDELSQVGMNVTQYTQKLRQALQLIGQGNYEQAENIIDQIMPELQQLYAQKDSYIFAENIKKYATIVAILSISPLFYYLFPRVYLRIWYKLRKKWIITET